MSISACFMVQKKNSKSSLQSRSVGGEPSALCPQSDFTFLSFVDFPPSNFPAQPQALLTLSWLPVTLASHLKAAAQLSIYSRGEERRTIQGGGREGEWQLFKGSNFKQWVPDLSTLKTFTLPPLFLPLPLSAKGAESEAELWTGEESRGAGWGRTDWAATLLEKQWHNRARRHCFLAPVNVWTLGRRASFHLHRLLHG